MTTEQWTVTRIKAAKGKRKLPCLTAYDYAMARLVDAAGIPLVLVGDSLAMTMLGYPNTLPVTVEEMMHHCKAVSRGAPHALVVADLPFLSYEASVEQAVLTAGRFVKEGGAHAVKIEGGAFRGPTVEALVRNGIPVLGHIGLTPQSIRQTGGYKVQGRAEADAERLAQDAAALDQAGVFALVLECVPVALAERITGSISVPTIGIGAGPDCDGQVLVFHDLVGLTVGRVPRHVKAYADLSTAIRRAVGEFRDEVRGGTFPGPDQSFD